jgi:hypothetical protein
MKIEDLDLAYGVLGSILTDISLTFPAIHRHQRASYKFIDAQIEKHGLEFYTLVLPDCGRWLDASIATKHLITGAPIHHGRRSKDDKRPAFMRHLYDRIFDSNGDALEEPCAESICFLREVYYFFKKFQVPCTQDRSNSTVVEFVAIEESLPRSWPGTWDSDIPSWRRRSGHPIWGDRPADDPRQGHLGYEPYGSLTPHDDIRWTDFHRLCDFVISSFGDLDVWALKPKHGPGAVADQNGTYKYKFENWSNKLSSVFPYDWFGKPDLGISDLDTEFNQYPSDREGSSTLCAVPKSAKSPRLISIEPLAQQWIQGSIQRYLVQRVQSSPLSLFIDFHDQGKSKQLALSSSEDDSLATVDLSSASDRLTTRLVESVFQSHSTLLDCLHASRTRSLVIPEGMDSSVQSERLLLLRKYAGQGNATTFSVQTIVYTLIGIFALMQVDDDYEVSWRAIRSKAQRLQVFGDDIIIDKKAYGSLVSTLESCLLKVNRGKSFSEGPFREACGMDAYNGVDVTPAYVTQAYDSSKPESLVATVEISNNFYKRGYWVTADYLQKTIAQAEVSLIPVSNRDIGPVTFFTFGSEFISSKTRYNPDTQVEEFRVLSVSRKKPRIRESTGESMLLQYFIEEPDKSILLEDWHAGLASKPRMRKHSRWVSN